MDGFLRGYLTACAIVAVAIAWPKAQSSLSEIRSHRSELDRLRARVDKLDPPEAWIPPEMPPVRVIVIADERVPA